MNPRPESRISSLEKRASSLEAGIEELAADTDTNFKNLSTDMQRSFDLVNGELQNIEVAMATKADIAALKTAQTEQGQKLDSMQKQLTQILTLLQNLSPDKNE
jgi:uncharacterized coiled-coil protein SlyX